jgi:hypothetical protein
MSFDPKRDENRDRWAELIASRLVAWEYSTDSLDDGDSIPPTPRAIYCALMNARAWMEAGEPSPLDIIIDGDGGILFQISKTPETEFSINFLSDGSIDKMYFRGAELVGRDHIPVS